MYKKSFSQVWITFGDPARALEDFWSDFIDVLTVSKERGLLITYTKDICVVGQFIWRNLTGLRRGSITSGKDFGICAKY